MAEAEAAVGRKHSLLPVVAGVVKSAAWDMSGDIFVTVFPACSAHAHAPGSCCRQVYPRLVSLNRTFSCLNPVTVQ